MSCVDRRAAATRGGGLVLLVVAAIAVIVATRGLACGSEWKDTVAPERGAVQAVEILDSDQSVLIVL